MSLEQAKQAKTLIVFEHGGACTAGVDPKSALWN